MKMELRFRYARLSGFLSGYATFTLNWPALHRMYFDTI